MQVYLESGEEKIGYLEEEVQSGKQRFFAMQQFNEQDGLLYQNTLTDMGDYILDYTSQIQDMNRRTGELAFENAVLRSDNEQLENELGNLKTAYMELNERMKVLSKMNEERENSLKGKIKDLPIR